MKRLQGKIDCFGEMSADLTVSYLGHYTKISDYRAGPVTETFKFSQSFFNKGHLNKS